MSTRSNYRTRQQNCLIDYLTQHEGQHFTAAQIHAHFAEGDQSIGTATVYRQLEKLVDEGVVRRYKLETEESAYYEYVGDNPGCSAHLHCKCERCGTLIHMDCEELEAIRRHLLEEHGFLWNPRRTVFYGICEACRGEEEQTKP